MKSFIHLSESIKFFKNQENLHLNPPRRGNINILWLLKEVSNIIQGKLGSNPQYKSYLFPFSYSLL